MSKAVRKCPRCGGSAPFDGEQFTCFACGHVVRNKKEKGAYFLSHKDDILKDVKEFGRVATMAKWQISPSGLHGCLVRWGYIPRTYRTMPAPASNGHEIPELPAWSDSWDPGVQKTWLETYQVLLTKS